MTDLVHAMGLVLLGWLLILLALVGLGRAVQRLLGPVQVSAQQILEAFWIGLAVAVATLQVWNLWLPVSATAPIVIAIAGLIGLLPGMRDTARWAWASVRTSPATVGALAVVALWLANRAIAACDAPDSGLYQVIGMRWGREHPVIPGLANLAGPLGFNNASWLYAAALDWGFWSQRGTHLAHSSLMLAVAAQSIVAVRGLVVRTGPVRAAYVFDIAMIVPVVDGAISPHGTSLTTDLPTVLALLVVASRLVRMLAVDDDAKSRAHAFVFVASVATVAATFKISAIAFAGGASLLALANLAKARPSRAIVLPVLVGGFALPAVLLAVWMVRGVIMSGYPVFPASILAFNVDWRVPEEPTAALRAWVLQFARDPTITPDRIHDGTSWIVPWAKKLLPLGPAKSLFPAVLAAFWAVVFVAMVVRRAPRRAIGPMWLVLLPTAVGLLFWLATAPSPRFGFFMFWTIAGAIAATAVGIFLQQAGRRVMAAIAIVQLSMVAPAIAARAIFVERAHKEGFPAIVRTLFVAPGPDEGFHPYPVVTYRSYTTASGLELWAPGVEDRMWNAPLPSTPYPLPNIALRVPGDLRSGFKMVGDAWEPEGWPHHGSTFYALWKASRGAPALPPAAPAPTSIDTSSPAPAQPAVTGGREGTR